MVSNSELKTLIARNNYETSQKGDWLSYWQDVANFCIPRKAWISTIKIYGEQLKFNYLYDSRAILALKKSAACFHSHLTNPASKWFDWRTMDDKYMQSGRSQRYFKACSDIQYGVINQSNWNEAQLENYTDHLWCGSAVMLTEEDYKTHVRYTEIPIEQVNIELDERGELLALYRNFKWTADMCARKFGKENLSADMKDALKEEKGYKKFDLLHYVGPRDKRDVAKMDNVNMAYMSVWIVPKEVHKLGEGGFTSNPYDFQRFWVHSDDKYGYSPAMDVLASIKLANAQKRTLIRRAMKDADQASATPARFWLGRLNQNPAAMNYYDKTKYSKEDFFTIPTGGNLNLPVEMLKLEQEIIDEGFFLPLFQALSNVTKEMNIPETQKRISESLGVIGPIVGRMTKGIAASQTRTFELINRRGLLPMPPKELQDVEMKMIFLGPLAKAQRASELSGLVQWAQFLGGLKDVIPNIVDNMEGDRIAEVSADMFNVDPTLVREESKVAAIRNKMAQAQAQKMQFEQAQQVADTAKKAADAKKSHAEALATK